MRLDLIHKDIFVVVAVFLFFFHSPTFAEGLTCELDEFLCV